MSIENKFHKLIEQQDNKRKTQIWAKLDSQIDSDETEDIFQENGTKVAIKNKKFIIPLISSAILLCVVVLILALVLRPSTPDSGVRFCSESDYSISETDLTLKDYAQESGKELLFLNWYSETEEYSAQVTRLNETNEIICFTENFIDIETGCPIKISVTDNKTQIDYLVPISVACTKTYQIDDAVIKWAGSRYEGLATFEYNSYLYYVSIIDPIEEVAILDLVSILLAK